MAQVAQAINRAADQLSRQIVQLEGSVNSGAKHVGDQIDDSNKLLGGVIAGVAATTLAVGQHKDATIAQFGETKAIVTKQTSAVVQMEMIRAYNEAVALRAKVDAFTEEIDERFDKAIEGVFINRILYDKHFQAIYSEYDNKIRTIGEHIFAIWEQDLLPAETAAKVPHSQYQNLAIEVDLERLARRSAQLDQDLEVIFESALGPRLDLDRAFERALSAKYGVDNPAPDGSRAAIAGIYLGGSGGRRRVIADALAEPARANGDGVSMRSAGAFTAFSEAAAASEVAERIGRAASKRAISDGELAQLREAIGRLVDRGLVPADLMPGIDAYLAKVSLQILESQEVKV
jgi:hypothetical protein